MIGRNTAISLKETIHARGLTLTKFRAFGPFRSVASVVTPTRPFADLTGLVGAIARKNRAGRLQQNFHIEHRRPYSGIFQIQPDHFVKRRLASPVHLP